VFGVRVLDGAVARLRTGKEARWLGPAGACEGGIGVSCVLDHAAGRPVVRSA